MAFKYTPAQIKKALVVVVAAVAGLVGNGVLPANVEHYVLLSLPFLTAAGVYQARNATRR